MDPSIVGSQKTPPRKEVRMPDEKKDQDQADDTDGQKRVLDDTEGQAKKGLGETEDDVEGQKKA
jgi:hypothetical protein